MVKFFTIIRDSSSLITIKDLDIGVVIDDSISVFEDDFSKEKEFVYRLYQKIDPPKSNSRISTSKFSTDATILVKFSDPASSDITLARKIIDCTTQTKGGTCIDRVLSVANEVIFASNETRPNMGKILIIVTDGSCNCPGCSELSLMAQKLKSESVTIITVGVGYGIDEEELKDISSDRKNFYPVKSFDELLDVLSSIFDTITDISETHSNNPDAISLKNEDYLSNSSRSKSGSSSDADNEFPYMNPIIVNIQTCPQSKVQHLACKSPKTRCFKVEKNFLLNPLEMTDKLCKCSELALQNNLNYFKLSDGGYCAIGTTNAECLQKKHKVDECDNLDLLYKATQLI